MVCVIPSWRGFYLWASGWSGGHPAAWGGGGLEALGPLRRWLGAVRGTVVPQAESERWGPPNRTLTLTLTLTLTVNPGS